MEPSKEQLCPVHIVYTLVPTCSFIIFRCEEKMREMLHEDVDSLQFIHHIHSLA